MAIKKLLNSKKALKRLVFGAIAVIVAGYIIDMGVLFSIYGCTGNDVSKNNCSGRHLQVSHIITRIVLVLTYISIVLLATILVALLMQKHKKPSHKH